MKHERPTLKELSDMIHSTLEIESCLYNANLPKEKQKKLQCNVQKIRRLLSDIEIEEKP
jgi:hypothetical protein